MRAIKFIIRLIKTLPLLIVAILMHTFGIIGNLFDWIAGKLEDFFDWYRINT